MSELQWTEAYSRPTSGATTPSAQYRGESLGSPHLQSFCPPIRVLSSSPSATFTKNAVKHSINDKGQLELLLPTMVTPVTTEGGKRRTRYTVLEYDPVRAI